MSNSVKTGLLCDVTDLGGEKLSTVILEILELELASWLFDNFGMGLVVGVRAEIVVVTHSSVIFFNVTLFDQYVMINKKIFTGVSSYKKWFW